MKREEETGIKRDERKTSVYLRGYARGEGSLKVI
jgi:hypothetical protein